MLTKKYCRKLQGNDKIFQDNEIRPDWYTYYVDKCYFSSVRYRFPLIEKSMLVYDTLIGVCRFGGSPLIYVNKAKKEISEQEKLAIKQQEIARKRAAADVLNAMFKC